MKRLLATAALSAILAPLALIGSAVASDVEYETARPTPTPEVWYPVKQNRPYGVAFSLDAPAAPNAYGIRRAARLVDEASPEIRIYRFGVRANTHVIKVVVKPMPEGIGGLAWVGREPIVLELERDIPAWGKPYLGAHEFAHALGLYHHMLPGAVGYAKATDHLTPVEIQVLRDYYKPPRTS